MAGVKPTILIVEDDQEIVELYRTTFEKDYILIITDDGNKALEICEKEKIDLIILDMLLPGKSGIDVQKCIKEHKKDTDFIIVTALDKDAKLAVESILELGAIDYIFKPFDPVKLKLTVDEYFNRADYSTSPDRILKNREVVMDLSTEKVNVSGREVVLKEKEFQLLHIFIGKPNIVLNRKWLHQRLFKKGNGSLRMCLSRLRDLYIKIYIILLSYFS
jgi:two-component system alkaline phosphatase synthesis response regulator PhoP